MSDNNGRPVPADPLADTKCKHCGKSFRSVPVPTIGQDSRKYATFNATLTRHIASDHPAVWSEIVQLAGQFNGVLLVNQFDMFDPQINEEQDRVRHKIFKKFQRVVISDATIEARVKKLEAVAYSGDPRSSEPTTPIDMASLVRITDVIALVKEMRDVLSENLLYPDQDQPIIVTPGSNTPS